MSPEILVVRYTVGPVKMEVRYRADSEDMDRLSKIVSVLGEVDGAEFVTYHPGDRREARSEHGHSGNGLGNAGS